MITRFRKEHLEELREKGAKGISKHLSSAQLSALENSPHSYSCLAKDGRVLGVGGVAEYWPGRGEAWAVLSPELSRRDVLSLHRAARLYILNSPVRRIEAAVEVDFEPGKRWVEALGFKREAERLEAFLPGGEDCVLYARVKR